MEQGNRPPKKEQAEDSFFASLATLTVAYDIEAIDVTEKPYPYNILLAHSCANRQLKKSGQEVKLSIMQDKKGAVQLATHHKYNVGMTLYYIPVLPLYRLLQDRAQKQTAELLLSVFSYLYHSAGISYYKEEDSTLGYHCECLREMYIEDGDGYGEAEHNTYVSALNEASHYGEVMQRKIYNLYHLNHFQQRIDIYKPKTALERACLKLAKTANALLEQYPNQTIHRNMASEENDDEYEYGVIRAAQYISFIAETKGALYENIAQGINDEFGEYNGMEEPARTQVFNMKDEPDAGGLDFEYKLFPLLIKLCTLLNDLP
ncbi:hypothetical protein RG47T_1187 [Mucilaginibacter polytrichastri]|uniref:Uncharacterized protein n=1 Tax=Mucilaginibacter polytrichastri TaxID=1302689 RepID=A0A1Q5ZVE1_9SPHI|nr:hypothetical protein RG47T_1187 [Mucilaginibacter polytrichastri]